MKKLLVALPLLATASWAGTTLYSGSQTRAAYDELVAQLDASTTLSVSAESYTAGFAASRAVTQVRRSDAPDAEVLFRLRHEIAHSPIGLDDGEARVGAARIVTTLVADGMDEEVRTLFASFDGGEPFVLESDVGFGGAVSHAFRISSFEHANAAGGDGSLTFAGAEYLVDVDGAGRLVGTGRIGEAVLDLPASGTRISMAPGTDRFAFDRVQEGVFTGEQHMSPGTLTIASQGMAIELHELAIDTLSATSDGRLESGATFAVGRIEAPMPLPIDAASVGVRVAGLELALLDTFMTGMNELSTADLDAFDVDGPSPSGELSGTEAERIAAAGAVADELLREVGALYAGLIRPGLSLRYDVALANAGGDVTASAGVLFEGDGSATGHDAMTTVGELVRALKLTATLDADADAVAMTPAAMFLAGGRLAPWIVSDANGYRSAIVVDDLIVDVNGEPLSLELMAGELLSLPLDLSMLVGMADSGGPSGR